MNWFSVCSKFLLRFLPMALFLFILFKSSYLFSQAAGADTASIKSQIDTCSGIGEPARTLECEKDLLKLIQGILNGPLNWKIKLFYKKAEIKTLRNIGNGYNDLSNLSRAMEYYQLSRKKSEEIVDNQGLAAALLNIGLIYTALEDYAKALDYQEKSLVLFREINDKRGIGICLNNIGNIYQNKEQYIKALDYFQNSLILQQERRDTFEIMTCFNNIGYVYERTEKYSKAMDYFQQGLSYAKRIRDVDGMSRSLSGLGNILYSTGKPGEAKYFYTEELKLSKESGNLVMQSEALKSLRGVFEKQGLYKEALANFDKHVQLKDSIFSQDQAQDIARRDTKYESDKKEAAMLAEQEKENAVAAAESKRQKIVIGSVIVGLLLVITFAGFIFRSLRITRKQKGVIEVKSRETEEQKKVIEEQKKVVEEQKKVVEERNKDITDSITYAKRIQQAKLPKKEDIYASLPQCFVLFKPKDIVSGDFYFFHNPTAHSGKTGVGSITGAADGVPVFIAAADCTGHGVPGAFMSMIGSEKLEEAVAQSSDTSVMLSLLNKGIKTSLKQSDSNESTRDGMDIALCAVDIKNRTVKYAAANRPLWIIRKGGQTAAGSLSQHLGGTVEEIKATKKAIGGFTEDDQQFDTHLVRLEQGDTFYIFSDGYADTFSGKNDKKLTTKKFKEVLLLIQEKSMADQEKHLDEFIEDWKSGSEQVDDILVIGVRM